MKMMMMRQFDEVSNNAAFITTSKATDDVRDLMQMFEAAPHDYLHDSFIPTWDEGLRDLCDFTTRATIELCINRYLRDNVYDLCEMPEAHDVKHRRLYSEVMNELKSHETQERLYVWHSMHEVMELMEKAKEDASAGVLNFSDRWGMRGYVRGLERARRYPTPFNSFMYLIFKIEDKTYSEQVVRDEFMDWWSEYKGNGYYFDVTL